MYCGIMMELTAGDNLFPRAHYPSSQSSIPVIPILPPVTTRAQNRILFNDELKNLPFRQWAAFLEPRQHPSIVKLLRVILWPAIRQIEKGQHQHPADHVLLPMHYYKADRGDDRGHNITAKETAGQQFCAAYCIQLRFSQE